MKTKPFLFKLLTIKCFIIATALLLSGCNKEAQQLINNQWKCVGYATTDNDSVQMPDSNYAQAQKYVVDFRDDNSFSGYALCNSFGGNYTTDHNNITITGGYCTEVYCGEEETDFITRLCAAESYKFIDNRLWLNYGNDQYLVFEVYTKSIFKQ